MHYTLTFVLQCVHISLSTRKYVCIYIYYGLSNVHYILYLFTDLLHVLCMSVPAVFVRVSNTSEQAKDSDFRRVKAVSSILIRWRLHLHPDFKQAPNGPGRHSVMETRTRSASVMLRPLRLQGLHAYGSNALLQDNTCKGSAAVIVVVVVVAVVVVVVQVSKCRSVVVV